MRTRRREMRRDGANHYEKRELREFRVRLDSSSLISQLRVPIWPVLTPIWGLPNPIRQLIPMISHIRSSTLFSSSFPVSLFLIHNSTIIAEKKVQSSLSISSCHDHELTMSTAYAEYNVHWVQHTPRALHTPSTASTQDSLSSLHSHDYELTPECHFIFRRASLHNRLPSNRLSMRAQM